MRSIGGTTFDRNTKIMHKRKGEILMRTALSIAGSDSSGGAGVQADLKTMTMNGVFAMSAITALTAQNTTGVTGILEADPEFLKKQIDAERLQHYKAENIVVDPVMVATSGSRLLEEDAVDTLKKELLPIATVITPNIPEAEILCGMEIHTEEDMVAAAKAIYEDLGCAVLLKGGHNINDANDLLYTKEEVSWFKGKRINNPNTHGTGCTLSSAIAANLAKGFDLKTSVQRAKDYISRALADMLDLGAGSGPMNHAFDLKDEWKEEA